MTFHFYRFHHLRAKLLFVYWILFFSVLTVFSVFTYFSIEQDVKETVNESLTMQMELIKHSIETSSEAAIKSYYRATAYAAFDTATVCYDKYLSGELSEREAKELAWSFLRVQSLGGAGYSAILDNEGMMVFHPHAEFVGEDFSNTEVTNKVLSNDESFIVYDWLNPGDTASRDKLLYSIYFKPWNWYICVTGYEDDLFSLVSISDFEDKILAIRFGETGYPIILDLNGTLLVHPQYKGVNMYDRQDSMGDMVREAIEKRNGRRYYYWKNPGESDYRRKLTLYSEIPRFGLIVAVTAYESEIMHPLINLQRIFIFSLLLSLGIIGGLTKKISDSITFPIVDIKKKMDAASEGELSIRAQIDSTDEIGEIGLHFNHFMEALQNKQRELHEQLRVNSEITERLQLSIEELQEAQKKLLEEERFSNMGRLLARISHHLNTPIGNVVLASSFLKEETGKFAISQIESGDGESEIEEHKNNILEASELMERSMDRVIDILKSFRMLQFDLEDRDLEERSVVAFLQESCADPWKNKIPQNLLFFLDGDEDIQLKTDFTLFQLVLDRLVSNSLEHSFKDKRSGEIRITVVQSEKGIDIVYADTGEGIPREASVRLFEPFFSPDKNFQSTGIGLNLIYSVISVGLEGTIQYQGDQSTGMKYLIHLPDIE